ncbi:oxaloacetate decarboxylase subunit alpha [Legionella lansingensis]|uniref:Oxaloacetate decarboxylase subunit alpha n=1 Tax=Legionella lansingensis TaxID=45067 RepID=A0A0W0VV14_9GAMM|nr:sodium-extruding oxaloacetate decarboxylase subunit alpha [Legionella lansingensis]KTD23870.1 oxaloacetate decarboxylase subunit alpha [Legionella lansingensis]SNV46565.1 oxaloacetate decarboxylase subunit alpha [Legionella lansingensis]
MAKTYITDVTLRDAHQCLIATRMRTEDMLPACQKMDKAGFWAMEVWGGATFDACLRFLKEDPWVRLRLLRKAIPNTRLSMLLRGQNLLGYRHYADDVVRGFIKLAAKNGVDVFRVFDALNDVRNLRVALEEVKRQKKHAQGAICYTTSPVHTLESFVDLGKKLADMGCDSIAIKDMAGLLTPMAAVSLYKALVDATGLPIHLHSHATAGLASISLYQAILAGCNHVDTAISSFSGGASHPATEALVAALVETEFDTGLNLNLLLDIGEYFKEVRKKYQQFEGEAREIDPRVQVYQVPGGMISNLYSQLKEQQALNKMSAVHAEIPRVRHDLGYPPLVTPTSQIVGTQAVLNVLTGERYKTITNEVKLYCQGKYGAAPGKISPRLRKKAIGHTEVIDVRPADLIPNELHRLRDEIGELAETDEDVLSYAMFPEIGKQFLAERKSNALRPEPLMTTPAVTKGNNFSEFNITLHGENYHIKVAGYGERERGQQACFLWVDGVPEEVIINVEEEPQEEAIVANGMNNKKRSPGFGDITVAMPGNIVNVNVTVGEQVMAGQALLVLEAMKMETEIQAPFAGIVKEVFCQKGDKVMPGQILMQLAK